LRRFTSRHGARALLDETTRAYRDSGIAYLKLDEDELFERLLAYQTLLKLPLVRVGSIVAVGVDERAWKDALTASA